MCSTAPRSEPAGLILAARSIADAQPGPAIHASADWLTNAPAPTIPSRSINCRRVRSCPSGMFILNPSHSNPHQTPADDSQPTD